MRLGIIQPLTGIGDMIVHVSHIRKLIEHYAPDHTILYTKKATHAHQYAHLMAVDQVQYLGNDRRVLRPDLERSAQIPKKTRVVTMIWQLYQQLKADQLDLMIILHPSIKYAIAAYLANIPKRYGYGYRGQQYFLTQAFGLSKYDIKIAYHTRKCDAFLSRLGITHKPLQPELRPHKSAETPKEKPMISIGIGASGTDKQWHEKNFIPLCQWVLQHTACDILLCGGKTEQYMVDAILAQVPTGAQHRVHSTCQSKLDECIISMNQSLCYVGNDTGFLHIAIALKKPTLGLFGSPYQAVLDYSPLITTCIPELTQAAKQSVPPNDHILHISPKQVIHQLLSMLHSLDQNTHAITATD